MDPQVTYAKLESLGRCLRRIRDRCPSTLEGLRDDLDAQDILSLNLERAVQVCVDLAAMWLADLDGPPPVSMRDAFLALGRQGQLPVDLASRLAGAVTLRNILVHEYIRTDWERVFWVVNHGLSDLEEFAAAILTGLPKS